MGQYRHIEVHFDRILDKVVQNFLFAPISNFCNLITYTMPIRILSICCIGKCLGCDDLVQTVPLLRYFHADQIHYHQLVPFALVKSLSEGLCEKFQSARLRTDREIRGIKPPFLVAISIQWISPVYVLSC